jgi:hypothetical protein
LGLNVHVGYINIIHAIIGILYSRDAQISKWKLMLDIMGNDEKDSAQLLVLFESEYKMINFGIFILWS